MEVFSPRSDHPNVQKQLTYVRTQQGHHTIFQNTMDQGEVDAKDLNFEYQNNPGLGSIITLVIYAFVENPHLKVNVENTAGNSYCGTELQKGKVTYHYRFSSGALTHGDNDLMDLHVLAGSVFTVQYIFLTYYIEVVYNATTSVQGKAQGEEMSHVKFHVHKGIALMEVHLHHETNRWSLFGGKLMDVILPPSYLRPGTVIVATGRCPKHSPVGIDVAESSNVIGSVKLGQPPEANYYIHAIVRILARSMVVYVDYLAAPVTYNFGGRVDGSSLNFTNFNQSNINVNCPSPK